jgi:hypothetical protein
MIHWRSWLCPAMWIALAASAPARADDLPITPANDPRPTLVTLHMADASMSDIAAKIAAQTGMPLGVGIGSPIAPLSVDVDQQPFWTVLDDLCKRSNSTIMPQWNNTPGLTIAAVGGSQPQRIVSGPTMLVFRDIQHLSQLTVSADHQDFCELTGEAIWEPRLKVLFADAWTIPTVAVDENGLSLVPDETTAASDSRQGYYQQNATGRFSVRQRFNNNDLFRRDLQVRLHVPASAGRTIKTLTGQWRFFVAKKVDHFDIPSLKVAKQRSTYVMGDLASLTMQFAQANDDSVNLQFTVPTSGDGTGPVSQDMARRNSLLQSMDIRVLDENGEPWGDTASGDFNGGQLNIGNGGNMMYIQAFIRRYPSAKGKPNKATVEGPVAATEIDVPFTLHDLPLP